MSEKFFDSLYARCPRCGSYISYDEDGGEICVKCHSELGKNDDTWDEYCEKVVVPIIEMDNRTPILVRDWKEKIKEEE